MSRPSSGPLSTWLRSRAEIRAILSEAAIENQADPGCATHRRANLGSPCIAGGWARRRPQLSRGFSSKTLFKP